MSKRGEYGNGRVYQPKYKAADGTVKTVSKWYVQYYDAGGNQHREPTEAKTEREARGLLRTRLGQVDQGTAPAPNSKNLRYGDIRAALLQHYATNKLKSLEVLSGTGEQTVKGMTKLDEFLGFRKNGPDDMGLKVAAITNGLWVKEFIEPRRKEGVSDATILNSGKLLRQMFKIAASPEFKLLSASQVPTFTMPKPPKPKKDFATKEEFDKLLTVLNPRFHPYATFLFYQATRKMEAADLTWGQIDLASAVYYPDAEKNKTGDDTPRPLADEVLPELRKLRQEGPDAQVFPHSAKAFHKAFEAACYELGLCRKAWQCSQCGAIKDAPAPNGEDDLALDCEACKKRFSARIPMQFHKVGLTVHGLRRSTVVFYRQGNMPDSDIMAVTGHKTNKTFLGYSVTRVEQLRKRLNGAGAERAKLLRLEAREPKRLTA
jgi:integrase